MKLGKEKAAIQETVRELRAAAKKEAGRDSHLSNGSVLPQSFSRSEDNQNKLESLNLNSIIHLGATEPPNREYKGTNDIQNLSDMVTKHVEGLTEITTIVKELSSWQIFKDIVLLDYQRQLFPMVEIEASKRRRDRVSHQKARIQTAGVTDNKVFQKVLEAMADTIDIKTALNLLKADIQKSIEKPPQNWEDGMRAKINHFILENLPNFEEGPSNSGKRSNLQSDPFGHSHDSSVSNSGQMLISGQRTSGANIISELANRQKDNHDLSAPFPRAGNHDTPVNRLTVRKIDRL
jgi:hypothetical protein